MVNTLHVLLLSLAATAASAAATPLTKASSITPSKNGSNIDPLANVHDAFSACQLASNCQIVAGSDGEKTIALKSQSGKDAVPSGSSQPGHIHTYVSYSNSSVEWGCGAAGEIDPSALVEKALNSNCGTTGCDNGPLKKQITFVPMNTGNKLEPGASGTLTIATSGSYAPQDRDNFFTGIQVLAGKGATTQNETFIESAAKRSLASKGQDLEARIEFPTGSAPVTSTCIATKHFEKMSIRRFFSVDGVPLLSSQMDIDVSVAIATPSNGFCSIIDPIGASLGGVLPGVGSAVAALFGLLEFAC